MSRTGAGRDDLWTRIRRAVEAVPVAARTPPEGARVGAVLALLEDAPDGTRLLLTRRREDMRSHPGQLSFPGGRVDPGETVEAAALREAQEEVGLRPESVEVIGAGPTFYIPPSRFWVAPLVARWVDPHPLDPNPWEVDEVLHVRLETLLERDRWRRVSLSDAGAVWAWQLDDDLLWGATAMMVATLLGVIDREWSGGLGPQDLAPDLEVRPWEDFPVPEPRVRLPGVPEVPFDRVDRVTAAQAREIDRRLREDAQVEVGQILEHAGRGVADATRRLLGGDLSGTRVTVLAGTGANGAAGLAAARLMASAGSEAHALLVGSPRFPTQVRGLASAGVRVDDLGPNAEPGDVVVDAMVGVGLRAPLEGPVADALDWLRRHDVPVVAVDLPTGVGPDRGVEGPCVTADVTVALGAPKIALADRLVRPFVGDLYLADLGVPRDVWRNVGVEPIDVFGRGPLVRLVFSVAQDEGVGA